MASESKLERSHKYKARRENMTQNTMSRKGYGRKVDGVSADEVLKSKKKSFKKVGIKIALKGFTFQH